MTARTEYWNARFDLSFSRVRLHLQLDDLMRQAEAIAETHRKYAPDQPRIPAGQSGGGQWTEGSGSLIRLAGGFKPEHMQMTVQQFRSKYCQGKIRAVLGDEFNHMKIVDVLAAAKSGDAKADTCKKLLERNEYRK